MSYLFKAVSMTSGGWSILCSSEWLRWQSGGSWTTASCAASLNCVLKVWLSYHVTCFEHCFKFFPFPQIFFGNCHVLGPIIKFCFGPRTVMVCSGAVRNTYSWNLVSSGGGRKIKELKNHTINAIFGKNRMTWEQIEGTQNMNLETQEGFLE